MGRADNHELVGQLRELLDAWLAELHRTITTKDSTRELGARVVPLDATPTGDVQASAVSGVLAGYALRNTDPANPATVYLRDGSDTSAPIVVPIQLAAGESTRDWFGPDNGPSFVAGLYVDLAAGAIEGALFLGRS